MITLTIIYIFLKYLTHHYSIHGLLWPGECFSFSLMQSNFLKGPFIQVFKPIAANLETVNYNSACSSLCQPIPAYSSLIQHIPSQYSLFIMFQPSAAYYLLFQFITDYYSLFQPITALSSQFQPIIFNILHGDFLRPQDTVFQNFGLVCRNKKIGNNRPFKLIWTKKEFKNFIPQFSTGLRGQPTSLASEASCIVLH